MITSKRVILALCVVFVRLESEKKAAQSVCNLIVNLISHRLEILKDANSSNYCAIETKMCTSCKDMIHKVRTSLNQVFVVNDFINTCNVYGIELLSSQCENISQQCLPEFTGLLDSNMTSVAICSSMQSPEKYTLAAEICINLIHKLKFVLVSKLIRTAVNNVPHLLCIFIYGGWKKKCAFYTDKYYDKFFKEMENVNTKTCAPFNHYNIGTNEIVAMRHVTELLHAMLKPLSYESHCFACKAVMNFIQMELENKSLRFYIKIVLNTICIVLIPTFGTSICQYYTGAGADVVMSFLAYEINVKRACPFFKLCTPHQVESSIGTKKDLGLSRSLEKSGETPYSGHMNIILELLCSELSGKKEKKLCIEHLESIKKQ